MFLCTRLIFLSFSMYEMQNIVPGEILEEVIELFVPENKLNLAVTDADTLPTISITEVLRLKQLLVRRFNKNSGRKPSFSLSLIKKTTSWLQESSALTQTVSLV